VVTRVGLSAIACARGCGDLPAVVAWVRDRGRRPPRWTRTFAHRTPTGTLSPPPCSTHTAAGRLTLDEYDQWVTAAWQAITLADLATLTADLPAEPTQRPRHRISPPVPLVVQAFSRFGAS
jgi:hypothetical protein